MNICIRVSIEYKMPMSEVRRCLTIKFTILLMLTATALAQSPDNNSIVGPNAANGGGVAKFRKYSYEICSLINISCGKLFSNQLPTFLYQSFKKMNVLFICT